MSKYKDTDYLAISTRLHALETRLLTAERMERMIEAKDDSDAAKILMECGYGELVHPSLPQLEALLSTSRAALFRELKGAVPQPEVVTLFQLQYDYHNAKILVKASATGRDPASLLVSGGRYAPAQLMEDFSRESLSDLCDHYKKAIISAKDCLAETGDPQLVDFLLDNAQYAEMTALATAVGDPFLQGYVRLLADSANLRSAVRALRMGKGGDLLKVALVSGGNVSLSAIITARGSDLPAVFSGLLSEAAKLGDGLVQNGGSMTAFERTCDDAILAYLAAAKRIPFGIQPVVGYLYARQAEQTTIRTILSGRLAGLDGDTIRARLRQSYE